MAYINVSKEGNMCRMQKIAKSFRVVVISALTTEPLEEIINEWLEHHPTAAVEHIGQSSTSAYTTVCIWYSP